MAELIFYFIGACLCVFSFLAVFSRNIFHSAVWLALALLSVAGIYFYLGAEFLGVIQILVYIGGIVTLFIFAIKLTAHIEDVKIRQTNEQFLSGGIVVLVIFTILLRVVVSHPRVTAGAGENLTSLREIGKSLMTVYALPFEFISLVLLAAMVGAIVIGKVKK